MANEFSKQETVAFEDILAGFNDSLTISRNVSKYGTNGELMERSSDTIWRPSPYILSSQDRVVGSDVTFQDVKQLSVPSTLGYEKTVPWKLTAKDMRDAMQERRLQTAAYQRLASDINTSVRDVVSVQGTLVAAISTAAGTYDDVALAQSMMSEQGIGSEGRYLALTARDHAGLSGNLAARQTVTGEVLTAYQKSYKGPIAGFETYAIDAGKRIGAAAGTSITVATNGAQVRFVPKSAESTVAGQINVDNRYQTVTFSSTSGMAAGDCFTIAGIESVHHITKDATGQLKTFRVISVTNGTTAVISPPMIGANLSPTDAELAYKNIEVTATSATAAVTFLNTVTAAANPFWHMDSVEILAGRYQVPDDQGPAVLRGTTDQGIEVVMTKEFSGTNMVSYYTVNAFWGVVNTNPEMNGIILWGQS